jgi:kinesin family protein 5
MAWCVVVFSWQFTKHAFKYSHVFGAEAGQEAVFEEVGRPMIEGVLDGFNGAIIAYGQVSGMVL